jgi:glycerol-3-phosphate dehydrogenase
MSEPVARHLAALYGSEHTRLFEAVASDPALGCQADPTSPVTRAEVVYAVRQEMAQRLADVVLRRTELGTGGYPGDAALRRCAEWMAAELSWNQARRESELAPLWAWRQSGQPPRP